jgi:nucleotide-binding universal stress UspA family protein
MYTTILWATDGSDGADVEFEEALRLEESTGARLLAVHADVRVAGRGAADVPVHVDELDVREKVRAQVERGRRAGVDAKLIVKLTHREPAELVATVALHAHADLIVCGTRGLGALSSAFLGSFTQRLLHLAPCPVLVLGPRSEAHEVTAGEVAGATQ